MHYNVRMSNDFRICLAFVAFLSPFYVFATRRKNITTAVGFPRHPKPNLSRTVPQGMTFRPCCLDSFWAVFPTFWWGGIWLWASANAILFRSPYHIRFFCALHPFPSLFLCVRHPSENILVLWFPLIAIPQFVWIPTVEYNTKNNTKYHWNWWQWEMKTYNCYLNEIEWYVGIEYICI